MRETERAPCAFVRPHVHVHTHTAVPTHTPTTRLADMAGTRLAEAGPGGGGGVQDGAAPLSGAAAMDVGRAPTTTTVTATPPPAAATPPPPPPPAKPHVNWAALDDMVLDFLGQEGCIEVRADWMRGETAKKKGCS